MLFGSGEAFFHGSAGALQYECSRDPQDRSEGKLLEKRENMGVKICESVIESEAYIQLTRAQRLPRNNDMEIALQVFEMRPQHR
jgi:hypothetical protein